MAATALHSVIMVFWKDRRRPHFTFVEPWTGVGIRMLFPWCHLWWWWYVCQRHDHVYVMSRNRCLSSKQVEDMQGPQKLETPKAQRERGLGGGPGRIPGLQRILAYLRPTKHF